MAKAKKKVSNVLLERMIRNDDIFCSLLHDQHNSTLRVVDFRGGNFQQKHGYLERLALSEGIRKVYTLIERDDMHGWQRSGYLREGTIPGYYKRSDAYIMGRIFDENWRGEPDSDDLPERKNFVADAKTMGTEFEDIKATGLKAEHIAEEEAPGILKAEISRMAQKTKKPAKGAKVPTADNGIDDIPLFRQFSREVDYHYFACHNKRTKQVNLFGAEYQDCFGNAKLNVFFEPKTKGEMTLVCYGLTKFIDWLAEIGAVSIFALTQTDSLELSAVYSSLGFRNSGWLNQQLVTDNGPVDQVLWTKKLLV